MLAGATSMYQGTNKEPISSIKVEKKVIVFAVTNAEPITIIVMINQIPCPFRHLDCRLGVSRRNASTVSNDTQQWSARDNTCELNV